MLHQLTFLPTFSGWQRAARGALQASWPPSEILWQEIDAKQPSLDLAEELEPSKLPVSTIKVPRAFLEAAKRVACARDEVRWGLLYRILWRLTHDEPKLLEIAVDADVLLFQQLDKAIRRDVHKMRAFVRFRAIAHEGQTWYVAWFEPAHPIVELNAPFFVDRFAGMCWSILTPDGCAHWDMKTLSFTAGVARSEAPSEDRMEDLWIRYYSSIFNPARVKTGAMQAEMPKKYWKNLPEATAIPALLREAPNRVSNMMAESHAKAQSEEDFHPIILPKHPTLPALREAAAHCRACPLYRHATQTVFGEGRSRARLVLVGEQPGDKEDLEGKPFIGPAGQLLDRALEEAGIDRREAYVTNAVKHFKWEPVGKRRLHKSPSAREIAACRPWLQGELAAIQPRVLVCLGGTAAKSVLGNEIRVLRDRGRFMTSDFSPQTLVTVHPSSLLRAPDEKTREENYQLFVRDLRVVAKALAAA